MLTVKQIATLIATEIKQQPVLLEAIETAAQKIYDLVKPDYTIHVAAAALENEVTSTLLDMLAATILATLIEEEGHGRSNISYSPASMAHMMQHYEYGAATEGTITTVTITMREDSPLKTEEGWLEPSNRHSIIDKAPPADDLKPQAEPHAYERPLWAMRAEMDGEPYLRSCHDRADAERFVRGMSQSSLPRIENRWCMHFACPASGCSHDETLRDPEPTSA